jgi:hypothetical protein
MSGSPEAYGRDHLMVIAAVRYCLGRSTYIVGDCADWLIPLWPSLPENVRKVLQRDIEQQFTRDDVARADGWEHKPLGADMDRREWERVRALWSEGASLCACFPGACRSQAVNGLTPSGQRCRAVTPAKGASS